MTRTQLVFGLGFVALGTVLLLDRGGALDAGAVVGDWWPSIVVVLGLAQLLVRPRQVAVGIFVTGLGIALLLWTVAGIDAVTLFWPLALVALGLVLLLRRPRRERAPEVSTDEDLVAIFDDRVVRAPAAPLGERSVTTIFGDVTLDLCDAELIAPTTLELVTIFGDVELRVPPDWLVTTSGPRILADVEVPAPQPGTSGAVVEGLELEVVAVFGDVKVVRSTTDRTRAS